MMAEILKIGVPTLVFQLLTSLSIALINRAASDYGDSVIAGMGAVTRITTVTLLVSAGLAALPVKGCSALRQLLQRFVSFPSSSLPHRTHLLG